MTYLRQIESIDQESKMRINLNLESAIRRSANALGVIVKTDHIMRYLVQNDPKALAQAREAFFAIEEFAGAIETTPIRICRECGRPAMRGVKLRQTPIKRSQTERQTERNS